MMPDVDCMECYLIGKASCSAHGYDDSAWCYCCDEPLEGWKHIAFTCADELLKKTGSIHKIDKEATEDFFRWDGQGNRFVQYGVVIVHTEDCPACRIRIPPECDTWDCEHGGHDDLIARYTEAT